MAHDDEFLTTSLRNTIKVDHFTKRLFDIYERVKKEGGPTQVKLKFIPVIGRERTLDCLLHLFPKFYVTFSYPLT